MLTRRQLLLAGALAPLALSNASIADPCPSSSSRWARYASNFIQSDGRVIDHNDEGKSTSEGQAYALFHALVANDQAKFRKILKWTADNLAGGDLARRLPAWKWGVDETKAWRILEDNSASDADLWLTYALLEGGRLWQDEALTRTGMAMQAMILKEETEAVPDLGTMLMPGRSGFKLSRCQWRFNPSYWPPQLFRALGKHVPDAPWRAMASPAVKAIIGASPKGLVPDWFIYDPEQGYLSDPEKGERSSYDAIRVYLWAGMLSSEDPLRVELLKSLPFRCAGACWPPEFSNTRSGERYGEGSAGFKAAVLPWLQAQGDAQCLTNMQQEIAASPAPTTPNYYDENLKLFALSFMDRAYSFDKDGLLQPAWTSSCQ